MPVLFEQREEKFAQFVAEGIKPQEARLQAGYGKGSRWTTKKLMNEPRIRERIDTLLQSAATRSVLTRMDILDGIKEEWRLARAAAQHGAALKAAEMLGSELHQMFRKQVEIGRAGDFDGKTEEELREYILNQMKDLGITPPSAPPMIEAKANPDQPVPSSSDNEASVER